MEIVIMDTDFAYEFFSKNEIAEAAVLDNKEFLFLLSFTSVAELIKAAFNLEMLSRLSGRIRKSNLDVLQVDENISAKALDLILSYHLNFAASIPDMLVAATALEYDGFLATCNKKHTYSAIKIVSTQCRTTAGWFSWT